MGFVAFGLMSIAMGLSARNETKSAFNRDIFHDRNQLLLYGMALLFVVLTDRAGLLAAHAGHDIAE